MSSPIVIIGGGQAAANASKAIRLLDASSQVVIVSEERVLPYERPPLSKKCMTGEKTLESCLFFEQEFYDKQEVELILGNRVVGVDFSARKLLFNDKESLSYDKLLLTTGTKNRVINVPGLTDKHILYLRSMSECQHIIDCMKSRDRVLIIGGGFIGLELSASLRALGRNVRVIEAGSQLMGRSIPKDVAQIVQARHEKAGVEIHLNTTVKHGSLSGASYEVELSTGDSVVCDLIIAGIGVEPDLDAFDSEAINLDNGIVVDEYGRTSVSDVYAAGDVANFYHPILDAQLRLESWKHAQNHGGVVGKNIAGAAEIYDEIPWMWSDQYDYVLQLSGVPIDYETRIKRGESVENGVIYFYQIGHQIGGACGGSIGPKIGRDIRAAGQLMKSRLEVSPEELEDPSFKLQTLLKKS